MLILVGRKVSGKIWKVNHKHLHYSTIRESVNSLRVRPSHLTEHRHVIPTNLAGNVFLADRAGNTSKSISFNFKPSRFNMKSKFPDDMRWKYSVRLLTANRAQPELLAWGSSYIKQTCPSGDTLFISCREGSNERFAFPIGSCVNPL